MRWAMKRRCSGLHKEEAQNERASSKMADPEKKLEPKKAHWAAIHASDVGLSLGEDSIIGHKCSVCGAGAFLDVGYNKEELTPFCPFCRAEMTEVDEE